MINFTIDLMISFVLLLTGQVMELAGIGQDQAQRRDSADIDPPAHPATMHHRARRTPANPAQPLGAECAPATGPATVD